MHSPVSIRHADLLNLLGALMRYYVDHHELGRLYREVVAVKLSGRSVFPLDLALYRTSRAGRPAGGPSKPRRPPPAQVS